MIIYENEIIGKGNSVSEFGNEMFILFGDSAPDTLKDYCYTIEPKKVNGEIKEGDILELDGSKFEILAVGNVAQKNFEDLGHLTVNFSESGDADEVLPGAIVVKGKNNGIDIGTVIRIEA